MSQDDRRDDKSSAPERTLLLPDLSGALNSSRELTGLCPCAQGEGPHIHEHGKIIPVREAAVIDMSVDTLPRSHVNAVNERRIIT